MLKLKRGYGRCVRIVGRGKVKTELYKRWIYLVSRSRGHSTKCPHLYEGIEVGFNGYDEFRTWALAHGYRKGMSPDRKDEKQGYTHNNTTWIPVAENRLKHRPYSTYRPGEEEPPAPDPYVPGEFSGEPGDDVPF